MPYVDADFLLAIIKEKDWLKSKALKIYEEHKGNLWTSGHTIAEILLISEEMGLDPEKIIVHIYRIVNVHGLEETTALLVSHYLKEGKLTAFDAFHAAYAQDDRIISSDKAYDRIGLQRIKLEE